MSEPVDENDSAAATFRDSLGAAVRKAGIGQVTPGEVPSAAALLKAVGGVRGLIEAILPGLGFLVVYTITHELVLSVLIPIVVAIAFVIIRIASKTPITQAFAGVVGIVLSAVLAIMTGRAEDNFLPGIIINASSVAVILVSLAVRWPLIGLIVGLLTNEGTRWRESRAKRRVLALATWLWAGLFGLRLAVQLPLYLGRQTEWLAGTKLLMGVPLYAAMLWITWLLVRAVYRRAEPTHAAADA